jgi:integrase
MASLFKRPDSAFWWINYRNPQTGKVVRESTHCRIGLMTETRKARQLCAERTLAERTNPQRVTNAEHWESWVPGWLDISYANKISTRVRYRAIEQNFYAYFKDKNIPIPRLLTPEHCFAYIPWRLRPQPGLHKARYNTILMELKILGMIMAQAIHRGYALTNPTAGMKLERVPPKDKPELTPDQLALVSAAIDADKSPYQTLLRRSFDIARYHGCRLNETWLNPQSDLFEERDADGITRWKIRFRAKGGKLHVVPLHPDLEPLLLKLKAEGETQTYERPLGHEGLPRTSRVWSDFLHRTGLRKTVPGITHHCLRVTVATQMARNGVPESKAMRYLGHASETVHRQYQKLKAGDLAACLDVTRQMNGKVVKG